MDVKSIIDCIDSPGIPGMDPIDDNCGFPASVFLSSNSCLFPAAAAAAAARFAAVNPKFPKPLGPRGNGNGEGKFPNNGFDCGLDGFVCEELFGVSGVVPALNGGNGASKVFLGGAL